MLIFIVRLGAVETIRRARDCLYKEYGTNEDVSIGWIMADDEVERVVTPEAYGQLPAHFKSLAGKLRARKLRSYEKTP